ncbi:MAG: phosphatase PAP2 family protein [Candidatus Phytoplasma pyri]
MIRNKKNIPIIKKYIKIYFLIIGIQFISYYCLVRIIKNYHPFYKIINDLVVNNKTIMKILNLGFIDDQGKFPDYDFLKHIIYIYLGVIYYWYFILPYLFYKYLDQKEKMQLYYLFTKTLIISYIIFIILPLEIPENHMFQNLDNNKFNTLNLTNLTNYLLKLTYDLDNPTCICPSLHVLFTYISFVIFRSNNKIPNYIIYGQMILTILVWISTFVLKQHFVIDGIISIILIEIFFYFIKKKKYRIIN